MGSSAGSTAPADGQTANAPSTSASSAPPVATCYFKSTDGHNNNWSFSTVRLNLHVAEAAAAAGGALLVDATRRGKVNGRQAGSRQAGAAPQANG